MGTIRKPRERQRAIQLREKGYSVKEIGNFLKVSSSTVSLWVRHIELSPAQRQRLTEKVFQTLQKGRVRAQKVQKEIRLKRQKALAEEALKQLGNFSERDRFISGIALYWAEGFKKDTRLGFANSDPAMVKFFLRWLDIAGVPSEDIRLRIGLNKSHKNRIKRVQEYWEQQTGIPATQFQKPFFQNFTWKKDFPDPEKYFGVLRIRANNQGALFTKIQAWISQFRIV